MALEFVQALDNLYVTTWSAIKREIVDNIFGATPLFFWLRDKGQVEEVEGGKMLEEPLMYGKNPSVKSFGRGDTFTLPDHEFLTMARFPWKYIGGSVTRYFVDDQQNRGKHMIFDRVKAAVENLKLSLIDALETQCFGAGVGTDIDGLAKIVRADAPTDAGQDVVGGIDGFTYSWWQNKRFDATGRSMSTYLVADMRHMYNLCSKGTDTPNLILTTQDIYEAYENELLEIHRIVDKKFADAGFENLTFKGKPIVWAPGCGAGLMYFLNSRYLKWKADKFANFDMTEWKTVNNSLDRAAQVVVVGNITVSNRARQGVIYNLTTP